MTGKPEIPDLFRITYRERLKTRMGGGYPGGSANMRGKGPAWREK